MPEPQLRLSVRLDRNRLRAENGRLRAEKAELVKALEDVLALLMSDRKYDAWDKARVLIRSNKNE